MKSIVLCEKSSQASNVRAAVGDRFGQVIGLQGHVLKLADPEDVNPDWKDWTYELLRPQSGFYPFAEDHSRGKDRIWRELKKSWQGVERIVIATDIGREGQAIGENLVRYMKFKGEVLRASFNAEDEATLRDAFANLRPNREFLPRYQAAVARAQADQIANLSATRAVTKALRPDGMKKALGVGRVKTPTMAIVCKRQLEIDRFTPRAYWDLWVSVEHDGESVRLNHRPAEQGRFFDQSAAQAVVGPLKGWSGPITVTRAEKRQAPPKLPDLAELQSKAAAWGWSASKTLEVGQSLYNTHKIATYPRVDARHLKEVEIANAPAMLEGLTGLGIFDISYQTPTIRKGKTGHFCDKSLEGEEHHAVVPNIRTADRWNEIYGKMDDDEKKLFKVIAQAYVAAVGPDRVYDRTEISIEADKRKFSAVGIVEKVSGWREALGKEAVESEEDGEESPPVPNWQHGVAGHVADTGLDAKVTKPPSAFNEGSLIAAMKEAWRYTDDPSLIARLKESKGIGTPATRDSVVSGLIEQGLVVSTKGKLAASPLALALYAELLKACPDWVDPASTAEMEMMLDAIMRGEAEPRAVIDKILERATNLISAMEKRAATAGPLEVDVKLPPSPKMLAAVKAKAARDGVSVPRGAASDARICREFLGPMSEGNGPTEGQVTFANKIAAALGVVVPEAALADRKQISAWIEAHKAKMPKPEGDDRPSSAQVGLAEKIAASKQIEIPPETLQSKSSLSKWIEAHGARSGKSAPTKKRKAGGKV